MRESDERVMADGSLAIGPGTGGARADGLAAPADVRVSWRDMVELTKPGIVRLVTISAGVGFALSAMYRPAWSAGGAALSGLACLIGVALSAAGANTLNQVLEVERDGRMERTADRPLPAGRVPLMRGALFGAFLCFMGLSLLGIVNGAPAAAVCFVTIATYLVVYTPLKPVTPLATVVGAVPGALPPVIGWAAASTTWHGGLLDAGGWMIFALMFVWQVPHFLAIAWKYREDYGRGGYRVLPVIDPSGGRTARACMLWSLALIPVSLAPVAAMGGLLGVGYSVVATLGGIGMVWASVKLATSRSDGAALALFLVSIAYLPLVLCAAVVDAGFSALV